MAKPDDPICKCGAPLSDHCPGNVAHGDYKEEARMVPMSYRTRTVTCTTRHCLSAMCSCVDFTPEGGAK